MMPAHKAFGLTKGKDAFAFEVPVWEWEGVHPHVPAADPHYVFRPFELMRVLYGIIANKRVYLHGHTGTGKTTLIEQVAARLNYPFMRLNFDSEISRMDLIGRDVLTSEGGTTISRFVDGILPQMMQSPCLGCFDEIDFVRPDIAYVMQRMLEGDALVLTEDGGRVVRPHPMFRAFATGNTVGQGDEFGMYQGARVQSTALLDRFAVWHRVDYLKEEDRDALIRGKVPGLNDSLRGKLNKYIGEHLQAFTTSKVLQPLSPRGFLGLADALVFFTGVIPDHKEAVKQALAASILDRASVQDRVVLSGLADRVFA
jgi:cobaltochelatase CobS